MTPPASLQPLGAVALVLRSFRLLSRHFGSLFPLAFVPALAISALGRALDPAPRAPEIPVASLETALALGFGVIVGFAVAGVLCLAALDALLSKRHTIGEYLRQTMRNIGPILVLGTLVTIAGLLGTLFLLVPGFYIFARFLPWTPAVVFENAGWSGLGRAQALTEGYRWPLVGATLLLGLAGVAIGAALAPLFVYAKDSAVLVLLLESLFQAFVWALSAILIAQVYLRLRALKEDTMIAEIAASIG
ncbi:MAG: hypothetical protein H0T41_11935 [Rhodobacteraceae bacterium]|nr:hypothetical protein [Paracoccaceae bacterium]